MFVEISHDLKLDELACLVNSALAQSQIHSPSTAIHFHLHFGLPT